MEIKKYIIELVTELKTRKLIQDNFKLIQKDGSVSEVEELTLLLLSRSESIQFYEKLRL